MLIVLVAGLFLGCVAVLIVKKNRESLLLAATLFFPDAVSYGNHDCHSQAGRRLRRGRSAFCTSPEICAFGFSTV